MMVAVNFFGLLPVMLGTGTGAETMKRVAAPMVGGLATSLLLELLVYPAIYSLWRERALRNGRAGGSSQDTEGLKIRNLVAGARGRLGWG
jgi:Cu(I)/Ag(I) efflux system membrane protein CusA/SilA